jgi:hypothetical protein
MARTGRPPKHSKEEKEKLVQYLKENYLEKRRTQEDIANELNCSRGELKSWISKYKICRNENLKIDDLQDGEVVGNVKILGKPFYQMESYGRRTRRFNYECLICGNKSSIRFASLNRHIKCKRYDYFCCGRKHNAKRIHNFNLPFFDNWSHDLAYIIGFLNADGNINGGSVRVNIQSKDVEVLEYMKDKIGYTGPIKNIKKYHDYKGKRITTDQVLLHISSVKLVEKISEYGIVPQKGGKEILPDIPDEYFYDYLRGLSDGDGSISITPIKNFKKDYNRKGLMLTICCASKDFLVKLKEKCENIGSISKMSHGECYRWSLGYRNSIKICSLMYKDDRFALKRKKDRYIEVIEDYKKYYKTDTVKYMVV